MNVTLQTVSSLNLSLILISCFWHTGHSAVLRVITASLFWEAICFKSITDPSISLIISGNPANTPPTLINTNNNSVIRLIISKSTHHTTNKKTPRMWGLSINYLIYSILFQVSLNLLSPNMTSWSKDEFWLFSFSFKVKLCPNNSGLLWFVIVSVILPDV